MHRPTVGIIALVLLGAAAATFAFGPLGDQSVFWASAFLRVGLVVGALWLALPQLRRWPSWLGKAILLVALLLVALKPKVLILAVGVYVVLVVLRPMTDTAPAANSRKSTDDRRRASTRK